MRINRNLPGFFDDDIFRGVMPQVAKTDIVEEKDKYVLTMDIPGAKKEDIKISLEDGILHIFAEMNEEKEQNGKYFLKERRHESISRSFNLGKDVTMEDIDASYDNGILKLNIKKKEEPEKEQRQYIEIK